MNANQVFEALVQLALDGMWGLMHDLCEEVGTTTMYGSDGARALLNAHHDGGRYDVSIDTETKNIPACSRRGDILRIKRVFYGDYVPEGGGIFVWVEGGKICVHTC